MPLLHLSVDGVLLNRPAPLIDLALQAGSATFEKLELPGRLEPGQGLVTVGFYRGPTPGKLALVAEQRAQVRSFPASRDAGLARSSLGLALASARPDDFIAPVDGADEGTGRGPVSDRAIVEDARRQLVRAASQASTVTRHSAMVALDARDRYAQDRLAGVKKWGPFAFLRLPPPPEREPGFELRAFTERDPDVSSKDGESEHRTGELDRDIIERLITTYVLPKARACYEKELRRNRGLRGSLVLVVEIARGEVQDVEVTRSTFTGGHIEACVADAAYTIQVPRVALGDDPETVGVARYPLAFRKLDDRGRVETGSTPAQPAYDDPHMNDDPLGGLEDRGP